MVNKCVGANIQEIDDVRNCNAYRGVTLLQHATKIVESAGEKNLISQHCCNAIRLYAWQRNDGRVLVVRRMRKQYKDNNIVVYSMCCVNIEKAFDSFQKSDRVSNEEKRFTRNNYKSNDGLLSRGKDKS